MGWSTVIRKWRVLSTMDDATGACGRWEPSDCRGTPYCPPRCPRFVDKEGVPLVVRRVERADLDDVVAMYRALDDYQRALGLPPAAEKLPEWVRSLHDRGWGLLAVRDGGSVVGHVAVVPGDAAVPEFVVFVHQNHQGRGVGTELVRQTVAHAADAGYEGLALDVSKGNRGAIHVYRRVGFRTVEETATALRMELSLSGAETTRVGLPPAERAEGS